MSYYVIKLFILICVAGLGNAGCTTWINIWEVYRYDIVDEAVRVLGLPDYEIIKQLNTGLDIEFVSPEQQVTVPYISPVSSPGTWITNGCSHTLLLQDAITTGFQNTNEYTQTTKPKIPDSSNIASTTGASVSKFISSVNQQPSSTSTISQDSNISSTSKSGYSSATTISQSSSTKEQQDPTQTQPYSSIHPSYTSPTQSSNIPAQIAPTSASASSTAASSPQCHALANFYTRNETQLKYAQEFCSKDASGFYNTSAPTSIVTLVQDDTEHFYMYSVEWLPNCQPGGSTKDDWINNCTNVMRLNYLQCNNWGQGGYTDLDCTRYDYRPVTPATYS